MHAELGGEKTGWLRTFGSWLAKILMVDGSSRSAPLEISLSYC